MFFLTKKKKKMYTELCTKSIFISHKVIVNPLESTWGLINVTRTCLFDYI